MTEENRFEGDDTPHLNESKLTEESSSTRQSVKEELPPHNAGASLGTVQKNTDESGKGENNISTSLKKSTVSRINTHMKAFGRAEKSLDELFEEALNLIDHEEYEREFSDLLQECHRIMKYPEAACEKIQSDPSCSEPVKKRAKKQLYELQIKLDDIKNLPDQAMDTFKVPVQYDNFCSISKRLVGPNLTSELDAAANDGPSTSSVKGKHNVSTIGKIKDLGMVNNLSNDLSRPNHASTVTFAQEDQVGLSPLLARTQQSTPGSPLRPPELDPNVSPYSNQSYVMGRGQSTDSGGSNAPYGYMSSYAMPPHLMYPGHGVIPPVTINKFGGDIKEYLEFKRKFKRFVADVYLDDEVRMTHLLSLCVGEAANAIRGLSGHLNRKFAYQTAWQRLDERFGNATLLSQQVRQELLEGPPIKQWDAAALNRFRDKMFECEYMYDGWGRASELNSSDVIDKLFDRMPVRIKNAFIPIYRQGRGTFRELRKLVDEAAADAECPLGKRLYQGTKEKVGRQSVISPQTSRSRNHVTINAVKEISNSVAQISKCISCQGAHKLWQCDHFKKKPVKDRNELVKQHRLCFNCLQSGHRVSDCTLKRKCNECGKKHNTLLHYEFKLDKAVPPASKSPEPGEKERLFVACNVCDKAQPGEGQTVHKVVPVQVWTDDLNKSVLTWAYLDEGSETSLCTTALAERLGAKLSKTKVKIETATGMTPARWQIDQMHVQGIEESKVFEVPRTLVLDSFVSDLPVPTNAFAQQFSHLQDLAFPKLPSDEVEILLGANVHNAFRMSELRYGEDDEPFGLHTALGWAIWGTEHVNQKEVRHEKAHVNFIQERGSIEESCQQVLQTLARDFEDLNLPQQQCPSRDDKRALRIMETSAKKVEGHHQVALPWKKDDVKLPNNRKLAEKRLYGLKKKLLADPELYKKYCDKISEYFANNYAIAIPVDKPAPEGRTWYVPHHCVLTKFRVVFDCSAKYGGVSLNDQLLQGPDLTSSLLGVLFRFRQRAIALVADVRTMFFQVLVAERDRDVFRFLWFPDNDLSKEPVDYQMRVHLFGAASSPSVAGFALRKTATDNLTNASQEAVNAVLKNFYVDDLCTSCDSVKEAVDLVKQLTALLRSGGFELTKFLSNDKQVLSCIPEKDRASSVVDLDQRQLPTTKALGVYWDAETDRLVVKVNIQDKPYTRRGLLSVIGQTYDPLGLVQPFILPGRQILQEICRLGLAWDEILPVGSVWGDKWAAFLQALPALENVSLERSFKLPNKQVEYRELHVFCDASTIGYGACAYLRTVYVDGLITTALVMGKSRVAPLKSISVPRLELTSAVLAAKIGTMICRELEFELSKVSYWTDATVVLSYLRNTTTRFQTFVANRLELLHSLTAADQWMHVPTALNPADMASRGISPLKVHEADLWFEGPAYLRECSSKWPKQPEFLGDVRDDDPEVKKMKVCATQLHEPENDILFQLLRRYSNFHVLQRTVAWLLRFKQLLKFKAVPGCTPPAKGLLTLDELSKATLAIVQAVQREAFPEAVTVLHNHQGFEEPVTPLTSDQLKRFPDLRKLQSLNPYVVDGVLRVGGRLHNAPLPDATKHPILLPNNHPVTDLLILMHHAKEGHLGCPQVLTAMNRKYWILKGRSTVKTALRSCRTCRFWQAKCGEQQMASLPAQRVNPSPPFCFTGTDLMGPLLVKLGRSTVKRYVCIFNCLATRAVHFETVQSLEASAFIQAFRRFCNRRVVRVRHMYSDNGGNFVRADRELNEGIRVWNSKKFQDAMLQEQIHWHFGPPLASHQNGFTEAFFRIVRKILRSVVGEATLDEFDLLTLMTEVERILNDRPLTDLPTEPGHLSALTPGMILTGSLADSVAPGVFMKADAFRQSWRKTQHLANQFWHRWLTEYLPLLQRRQKWFTPSPNFKPGDLVLIKDECAKRGCWPKGVIEGVLPDRNGLVRRVSVRTANSTLVRDVRKLCLLEGLPDEERQ